jgi:hypothetical protein
MASDLGFEVVVIDLIGQFRNDVAPYAFLDEDPKGVIAPSEFVDVASSQQAVKSDSELL